MAADSRHRTAVDRGLADSPLAGLAAVDRRPADNLPAVRMVDRCGELPGEVEYRHHRGLVGSGPVPGWDSSSWLCSPFAKVTNTILFIFVLRRRTKMNRIVLTIISGFLAASSQGYRPVYTPGIPGMPWFAYLSAISPTMGNLKYLP